MTFYSLQLRETAKKDTRDFKGVAVTKDSKVYVETEQSDTRDIVKQADRAGIEALEVTQLPERGDDGNKLYPRTLGA